MLLNARATTVRFQFTTLEVVKLSSEVIERFLLPKNCNAGGSDERFPWHVFT
jgi:hypothetical protein